jgi:hypothetical protein
VTYVLRAHAREAEPYEDLLDEEEVRAAVEQECRTTVDDLGSDVLDSGSEQEREEAARSMADAAMADLWDPAALERRVTKHHRLLGEVVDHATGRRRSGLLLTLESESD